MTLPPFPVEDQTDEDFFDKLVEDEGDASGSSRVFEEHLESDDVRAFEKLRIGEVGKYEGVEDSVDGFEGEVTDGWVNEDLASFPVDPDSDNIAPEAAAIESSVQDRSEVTDVNVMGVSKGLDEGNVKGGVKEVQWSAFSSDINDGAGDFFGGIEGNIEDSFGQVAEISAFGSGSFTGVSSTTVENPSLSSHVQHDENLSNSVYTENGSYPAQGESQEGDMYAENTSQVQDVNSIEYWESLYPGWKCDLNTGQWYQVDSSNLIANEQENCNAISQSTGEVNVAEQQAGVYHLQQTAQSSVGNVIQESSNDNTTYWNQTTGDAHEYPPHMIFDPQYPGWYYDTIAQDWKSLESYAASMNPVQSLDQSQPLQNGYDAKVHYQDNSGSYDQHGHDQTHPMDWGASANDYHDQNTNVWKNQAMPMNGHVQSVHAEGSIDKSSFMVPSYANIDSSRGFDGSNGMSAYESFVPDQSSNVNDSTNSRQTVTESTLRTFSDQTSQSFDGSNGMPGFQSFVPAQNFSMNHIDHNKGYNYQPQFSPTPIYGTDFSNFSNQPLERGSQIPSIPADGRSPDGRPPHALVAFGFGGKLIVMKDHISATNSSFANQDSAGSVVNVLNLMEVVMMPKSDGTGVGDVGSDYFHTLCNQSFPGPLVSGNVGNKELNKWIDDRVANSGIQENNYPKTEVTRMLFSLLKIACQYYGKLRSPFGTDHALKENDCPESALARLFASTKVNNAQFTQYGALTSCLQSLPSTEQTQATALEVEKLLVTGRRMEALQCAQEGQLWGPAMVIAAQLGDMFYSETVKQMAINQLVSGCPMRTLCLLIAGQPAEVFSSSAMNNNLSGSLTVSQPAQVGSNCMLDKWEENLAIITANRTKGDELVITHLGDCLWKERSEVIAAHICYLVAEANIELYSDSARLCLIGADHWKNPRTFATPEAIQRTELFEYSKVLGNSQFSLLPFQPYKLVYANMLAEVGKLSDSLKYCQAILKTLKTGRAPEVDAWRNLVSSLEERIKIHQQGGYTANLAPGKVFGKLLNFFDSTAQRVVGLPPAAPSPSLSNGQHNENNYQERCNRVSTSQSTVAMSSLASSASLEPLNSNNRKLHNRSISEPDISRKAHSSDKSTSSSAQDNTGTSAAPSRLGRFGSQIFQKTVGLVLRSNTEKQAKLGETNKFYYDEKLKRWVEEGVEPPAEETALAPPPTAAAFMNGMPDQHMNNGSATATFHGNGELQFKSPEPVERSSVMPPMSPATNQFSSRARMGVRSRYVDTFNKGGGGAIATNSFQSPPIPAAKPAGFSNAKFFVPTAAPAVEQNTQFTEHNTEASMPDYTSNDQTNSFSPPPELPQMNAPSVQMQPQTNAPSVQLQRYPSENSLVTSNRGVAPIINNNPLQHSRRTASWSGTNYEDFMAHPNNTEPQPNVNAPGFAPYIPNGHFPGNASEDLQDVEL